MPGVPCVYYGSEWGMEGGKEDGDAALRPAVDMPQKNGLTEYIARLAAARRGSRALCHGAYRTVLLTNRQYIFERAAEGERVLVAVNAEGEPFDAHFDAGAGRAVDLVTGRPHDFGRRQPSCAVQRGLLARGVNGRGKWAGKKRGRPADKAGRPRCFAFFEKNECLIILNLSISLHVNDYVCA